MIDLNWAVALGMARGPLVGLMKLDQLKLEDSLGEYHWFHATRADLLQRAGYGPEAKEAYARALALCQNRTERSLLARRLTEISTDVNG